MLSSNGKTIITAEIRGWIYAIQVTLQSAGTTATNQPFSNFQRTAKLFKFPKENNNKDWDILCSAL